MFQRLYRLGGLRSSPLACGSLRVATLGVCLIAVGDVAYPADSLDGEGGSRAQPRVSKKRKCIPSGTGASTWNRRMEISSFREERSKHGNDPLPDCF